MSQKWFSWQSGDLENKSKPQPAFSIQHQALEACPYTHPLQQIVPPPSTPKHTFKGSLDPTQLRIPASAMGDDLIFSPSTLRDSRTSEWENHKPKKPRKTCPWTYLSSRLQCQLGVLQMLESLGKCLQLRYNHLPLFHTSLSLNLHSSPSSFSNPPKLCWVLLRPTGSSFFFFFFIGS